MVYLDTSILVPLSLRASDTEAARAGMAKLREGEAGTSAWAMLEFTSVLGRRVRGRELAAADALGALERMQELADASLHMLGAEAGDYSQARQWVAEFDSGLRAADALHLAIAYRSAARLFTFDKGLQAAARRFGVALYR